MTKRVPITQFFPLEITEWLTSTTVLSMWPESRALYLHLLLQGWLNVSKPCHVPNDVNVLWTLAGAPSKQYFAYTARTNKVMEMFQKCGGGQWLCNVKSLRLYLSKLCTYYKGTPPAETLIFVLNDCTCLSKEEKERLRGNDGGNDTEQLVENIRRLGFRDSQAIAVEHSIADELARGESGNKLLDKLRAIYIWTENGVYAPRLHEVIRRWKEPQHLWERKTQRERVHQSGLPQSAISYFTHIKCYVCKKDLGPGNEKDGPYVCSDECAAKSGYEVTP